MGIEAPYGTAPSTPAPSPSLSSHKTSLFGSSYPSIYVYPGTILLFFFSPKLLICFLFLAFLYTFLNPTTQPTTSINPDGTITRSSSSTTNKGGGGYKGRSNVKGMGDLPKSAPSA